MKNTDGIAKISGVFDYGYFCEKCLIAYKNKGRHSCETSCDICASNKCVVGTDSMSCIFCYRECRSQACYDRHVEKTDKKGREISKSMCEKWYQCKKYRKVLDRSKRKPELHTYREWRCQICHQFQTNQHFCYQRVPDTKPHTIPRKFFFFDFETYQQTDYVFECQQGYTPNNPCKDKCTVGLRCTKCRICRNCSETTCGLYEHKVFYAVLQSTCEKCGANEEDDEVTPQSRCSTCGSRCKKCRIFKEKEPVMPCPLTCGFRQRIFSGTDVPSQFCSHIMTPYYKNTVFMAHNAKEFDNYPILNALIDHHGVKPNKILYNGSKIMYMHIAHGLDLTFIDSLNFLQMKLSKIPECLEIKELQKGYFPHLFSNPSRFECRDVDWPAPCYYGHNVGEKPQNLHGMVRNEEERSIRFSRRTIQVYGRGRSNIAPRCNEISTSHATSDVKREFEWRYG